MKTGILYMLLFCCSLISYSQGIYEHSVLQADKHNVLSWISIDSTLQKENQWICFRKEIQLDSKKKHVPMIIAVDSKYWLWINGKLVIFEGGLKRGPNPFDTYYDEVDIADYLRKGNNTIAILLWYWGKDGFCHKDSGKSGLLARIQIGDKAIVTDGSWKVKLHPAFLETGDPKPNFRLPESNVHFDARLDIGDWQASEFDDSSWANAFVLGTYPCAPWNKLYKRPFPNWADLGLMSYDEVIREAKDDSLFVRGKLPKNITVTPYIKLKAKAGALIDIRTDNYKGGSEYNVRAEYVTKDGIQTFEMPNYVNGHEVIYSLPKGVNCLEVGYRETRFNTQHIGYFECSDSFYNKLWEKSLNTMNLNMRDAIQDPDRERSQWWGDAAIILHEIFYSCDTNGYAAVKKAILNLVDWQKADGGLFSPIPEGSWDKELPLQMLASIGKYGFWSYYWYTGDLSCVKYIYPKMKKYLSLWEVDEHGLVKHRAGGWDWADWGEEIDVAVLDNAWYCLALESAIQMGKLLDDHLFVAYYQAQLALVKHASKTTFWNGQVFRSPQYQGVTDDRANGLALLAGFATMEQAEKVVGYLKSYEKASPYMERYILEALFAHGYITEGLARMKKRYEHMVASPLTSLWEDWAVGGYGGGSINHGWAGGPLPLLSRYIAGVSPLEAGWNKILVNPQLGDLKWVKCTVPVFNRELKIEVHATDGSWKLSVENGTEKECIIALPKRQLRTSISVAGQNLQYIGGKLEKNDWMEVYSPVNGETIPEDRVLFKLKKQKVSISI